MSTIPAETMNILLIGMTGQGKSSTGNKLIDAGPGNDNVEQRTSVRIQGLLLHQSISEAGRSHLAFEESDTLTESTTKTCQLLLNKLHRVCVLDVPGFSADSSTAKECGVFQANLGIFRSILRIQEDLNMPFHRIVYFLPIRGPLEKASGDLQEEIKVMYHFCGNAIFERMVLVATNHKRRQKFGFTSDDKSDTRETFKRSFELATGARCPFDANGPPIVYVSFEDDGATLRKKISEAQVTNKTGFYCGFVETVCAKCAITIRSSDGEELGSNTTKDPQGALKDVNDSKCHPIFLPRYSTLEKIIGGVAHITTTVGIPYPVSQLVGDERCFPFVRFFNSDEICPKCNNPPGTPGCTRIRAGPCTIEWHGKKETIMTVDHTNRVIDTVVAK